MYAKTKTYTKKVYLSTKSATFLVRAILPQVAKINKSFIRRRSCRDAISTACMMPLASLWGAA